MYEYKTVSLVENIEEKLVALKTLFLFTYYYLSCVIGNIFVDCMANCTQISNKTSRSHTHTNTIKYTILFFIRN